MESQLLSQQAAVETVQRLLKTVLFAMKTPLAENVTLDFGLLQQAEFANPYSITVMPILKIIS